jgi:hypothetical protein
MKVLVVIALGVALALIGWFLYWAIPISKKREI